MTFENEKRYRLTAICQRRVQMALNGSPGSFYPAGMKPADYFSFLRDEI